MTETLICHVHSARNLYNTEWVKNMDPYVTVRVGNQVKKTKVIRGGGTRVIWNEDLVFNFYGNSDIIIEVMDEETFNEDRPIGSCVVQVSQGPFSGEVQLFRKNNQPAGFLRLSVHLVSQGSAPANNSSLTQQALSDYQVNTVARAYPVTPPVVPQPIIFTQPQPVIYAQPQPVIYAQPQPVIYTQPYQHQYVAYQPYRTTRVYDNSRSTRSADIATAAAVGVLGGALLGAMHRH